jgi:hypothetical protein
MERDEYKEGGAIFGQSARCVTIPIAAGFDGEAICLAAESAIVATPLRQRP